MSDPLSVQAAALAAVDRLIEFDRLMLLPARPGGARHRVGEGARRSIAESLAGLEGRRRILQRHAPREDWWCAHCVTDQSTSGDAPWPCEDWRDAAAGLPLDQDLGEESDGNDGR